MAVAERRAREQEARRRCILDAARDALLEQGIAATTMEDIARRAELSKGALYLYFESKDELCFALLLEASEALVEAIRAGVRPDLHPLEQLKQIGAAYYRFYGSHPDYFRFMFVLEHRPYAGRVPDDLLDRWSAISRRGLEVLAQILERGRQRGLVRPIDPWRTAVALWSAVTGLIVIPSQEVRWEFLGKLDSEALILATLENFWEGIALPARSPGGGTQPTSEP
jgi:AcrR family transcriptional regulator